MTPTQQKTSALVALWYQLVNLDHHKDRDCHWSIETAYSYDGQLAFRVRHYGYVHREVDRECNDYPEAEAALLEELVKAFQEQFESAEERAKDGEKYDTDPQLILALKPEFERIAGAECATGPDVPEPQSAWNAAIGEAIDVVRDVLREEESPLTYLAADAVQQRLRERLQARIDALMLEYCPGEMTPEQLANGEKHQRAVPAEALSANEQSPRAPQAKGTAIERASSYRAEILDAAVQCGDWDGVTCEVNYPPLKPNSL